MIGGIYTVRKTLIWLQRLLRLILQINLLVEPSWMAAQSQSPFCSVVERPGCKICGVEVTALIKVEAADKVLAHL